MHLDGPDIYPIIIRTISFSHVFLFTADGSLLLTLFTVAVLRGDSSVGGTVYFEQAPGDAETVIKYKIQGNDPSAERGMHIHQFGDNTNGCTSAGPHCMFPSSSSSTASSSSSSSYSPLLPSSLLLLIYIVRGSTSHKGEKPKKEC